MDKGVVWTKTACPSYTVGQTILVEIQLYIEDSLYSWTFVLGTQKGQESVSIV